MRMYKIKLYNNISDKGLNQFTPEFEVHANIENEDAILVRSANLHELNYNKNLKAIARAGAGTNNIDIETCTNKGIVVFNTPGANSNAVKELVFAGLLLASRDIYHGVEWCKKQVENENITKDVEKQKKQYAGTELNGKTLGVIGLGAIGIQVANLAVDFGMNVLGYDPYISVDNAWKMSRHVKHVETIQDLLKESDFITLHIPLLETTKNTIDEKALQIAKDGVKILNFARGGLVDHQALKQALHTNKVAMYVTDFPDKDLIQEEHVIPIPHLGASTQESEENCAIKAVNEISEYLKYGNIKNSVNLPNASAPMESPYRIALIHKNKPKMISQITDVLSTLEINIENLINKSKKEIAYTIIDTNQPVLPESLEQIQNIDGMIRVNTYEL